MATSRQSTISQERVDEITKCPICLGTTDTPRSLPCLHAFCHKCLQQHFKDLNPGDAIVCPLCRSKYIYPDNGVDGFPHNFFIQNLIDSSKETRTTTEGGEAVICEACAEVEADDVPRATMHCVDCNQNVCKRCGVLHSRIRRGRPHNVVNLEESRNPEFVKQRDSYCESDADELVKMYCTECHINICVVCFALQHQQHKCLKIEDAAAGFRQDINNDLQVVEGQTDKVKAMQGKLKADRTKLTNKFSALEKSVQQKAAERKKTIDARVNELLNELGEIKHKEDKQLGLCADELETALISMESYCNYVQELVSKGRPADISKVGRELRQRATELGQMDLSSCKYQLSEVVFTPCVVPMNLIGCLDIVSGNQSRNKISDTEKLLEQPHRFPQQEHVILPEVYESLSVDVAGWSGVSVDGVGGSRVRQLRKDPATTATSQLVDVGSHAIDNSNSDERTCLSLDMSNIVTVSIDISLVKVDYIEKHLSQELNKIKDRLLTLRMDRDGTKWTLTANSRKAAETALTRLIELVSRVIVRRVKVPVNMDLDEICAAFAKNKYKSVAIDLTNIDSGECEIYGLEESDVYSTKIFNTG